MLIVLLSSVKVQFPQASALVVYGVTEGGPVPLGPHPEGKERPLGSIGAPYHGTAAKLVGGNSPEEGELAGMVGRQACRDRCRGCSRAR